MAGMDTMATMARGRLRQLLWLLLSQKLLPSLATDTTAMVDTEDMAMADMVTTAIMARGLLMLMPTKATEDMVMDTAMDMVTAMATAMARDLRMPTTATEDTADMVMATAMARGLLMLMPTTATEDTEDMVMDTAMATVMDMDTTDKKEGVAMMSRVQWIHNEMDL